MGMEYLIRPWIGAQENKDRLSTIVYRKIASVVSG